MLNNVVSTDRMHLDNLARAAFKEKIFFPRLHSHNIWRKATICNQGQLIAPSQQEELTVDPVDTRQVLFVSCATNGTGLVPLSSIARVLLGKQLECALKAVSK